MPHSDFKPKLNLDEVPRFNISLKEVADFDSLS